MRRQLHSFRDFILPVIDFFYPPFRRIMNIQTFRYAAAGGGNLLLGLTTYAICYKYILKEQNLDIGFYAFKAHVAALFASFCITLPVGFFMSKYVVFTDSKMKGRVQFFRYFMIFLFNLFINYILLKILVEQFHIYAVVAQIGTTVVVVVISYLAQRNFSFKASPPDE